MFGGKNFRKTELTLHFEHQLHQNKSSANFGCIIMFFKKQTKP